MLAKIDDLENWSKGNNVFWNIPEGAEDGSTCEEIIQEILVNHRNLERESEIMSPLHNNKEQSKQTKWRAVIKTDTCSIVTVSRKAVYIKKHCCKDQGQSLSSRKNLHFVMFERQRGTRGRF